MCGTLDFSVFHILLFSPHAVKQPRVGFHPWALAGHLRTGEQALVCTPCCLPEAQRLSGQEWCALLSVHQSHSQFVLTVLLQLEEEKECRTNSLTNDCAVDIPSYRVVLPVAVPSRCRRHCFFSFP